MTEAANFLESYVGARAGMLEQGLLDDLDPRTVMREIEEFKTKIENRDAHPRAEGQD